jgi:hypothetical protein
VNQHWFLSLHDARSESEVWRVAYNESRRNGVMEKEIPTYIAHRCLQTDAIARPTNSENSKSRQFQKRMKAAWHSGAASLPGWRTWILTSLRNFAKVQE